MPWTRNAEQETVTEELVETGEQALSEEEITRREPEKTGEW